MPPLPLSGVRIVDLTMAWAGPMAVRFLADMGAEVIKIEAATHMDRWRGGTFAQRGTERYPDHTPGERPWNRSSFFNTQNRNKKSLVLDLKTDKGKDIFKRLVAVSDIVAENFSAGAMGRLNLDYPVLREIKPDIIMLSMPAFGRTGPERDFIAHGPTIEEIAGTTFLQGYADGPPMPSGGLAWGDPVAGVNGASAAMIALVHRQETGQGQHIDLSHVEVGAGFNIDALLTQTMLGQTTPRRGNRDTAMAPHGAYPCKGEDRWISIAVGSDDEWCKLKAAMGRPAWADDCRFDTLLGRWDHQTEIDRQLAEWTAQHDHRVLAAQLQEAGVPAGPLQDARDLSEDPHLNERGFFETVEHPESGTHPYPGMPWKLSDTPASIRMPAPLFGQHNEEVLTSLLGMNPAEVRALEDEGVITTEPRPQGD
jgi:crotonobetainyl-CoA:carnitine CoA-transferase CaiB-like acyl-CoA transferase